MTWAEDYAAAHVEAQKLRREQDDIETRLALANKRMQEAEQAGRAVFEAIKAAAVKGAKAA